MLTVLDIADYILKKEGAMTAMKLQKLTYYCQAWFLVKFSKPLFPEDILAWEYGPVVYDLYKAHRGRFTVEEIHGGSSEKISPQQTKFIDKVLGYYGQFDGVKLSTSTHEEDPWKHAMKTEEKIITTESLIGYYGKIPVPFQI